MYSSFRYAPGRSGFARRIAQAQNKIRYPRSKQLADVLQGCRSSLVFHRIVQQRSDGFVLIAPILQDEGSYPEQVRQVGNGRALPHLPVMQPVGIKESVVEACGQGWGALNKSSIRRPVRQNAVDLLGSFHVFRPIRTAEGNLVSNPLQ